MSLLALPRRQPPRRSTLSTAGFVALSCLLVGCRPVDDVRTYTSVKQSQIELENPAPVVETKDRMLAAIVPHNDTYWFLKLAGPKEAVASQTKPFEGFVRTIRFDDNGPVWDLPTGWEQLPASGLRFATIVVPSGGPKPLDLSVSSLPRRAEEDASAILANVNRWRGQMQARPVSERQLSEVVRKVPLADGEATLVDVDGTLAADGSMGGRAPFASGALPPAAAPNVPAPLANDGPATPFKCKTPEGWIAGKAGGMRKAEFAVVDGNEKIEITVIDLEAAAGELLPNINRWRQQIDLPPTTQDKLAADLKPIVIGGHAGHYIELAGPAGPGPRSILGAVCVQGGKAWFFKLMGDSALAKREQPKFAEFLQSITF